MNWNEVVEMVSPTVVKIETPSGHGSGFFVFQSEIFVGIATAKHVIDHADKWQQPIRIIKGTDVVFLSVAERVILQAQDLKDSAVILLDPKRLEFATSPIPLRPINARLPIGGEVGWLGFPAAAPQDLCFFSGTVSAIQAWRNAYLLDGVSINGVSGGPVLYSTPHHGVQIIGAITAYIANRATGEALPGLAVAQDVSHLQEIVGQLKSLDDARQKEAQEKAAETSASPSPEPSPSPSLEPPDEAIVESEGSS